MSANINLVQINNRTRSEATFANIETSADDMEMCANGPTNTPGQYGDGCHIPDCAAGKRWDDHRMTITLGNTILSLWKEGDRVYYRPDQTVYPGKGCGSLLWADNGMPVVLDIAPDSTATMCNP